MEGEGRTKESCPPLTQLYDTVTIFLSEKFGETMKHILVLFVWRLACCAHREQNLITKWYFCIINLHCNCSIFGERGWENETALKFQTNQIMRWAQIKTHFSSPSLGWLQLLMEKYRKRFFFSLFIVCYDRKNVLRAQKLIKHSRWKYSSARLGCRKQCNDAAFSLHRWRCTTFYSPLSVSLFIHQVLKTIMTS